MADAGNNIGKGEYVIGVAIILAALLVCATVYFGLGGLQSAIAGIKLGTAAATAGATTSGNVQAVAPETLKPKIEAFINDNFLSSQGVSARVNSIAAYDNYLYLANASIMNGTRILQSNLPIYITKDGASILIGAKAYKTDQPVPNPSASGSVGASAAPATPTGDWSFVSSLPYVGPSNAKVTVVLFTDPQCPYCEIAEGREFGGANLDAIRGVIPKIVGEYANTSKAKVAYSVMAFLDARDGSSHESTAAANAELCARNISGNGGYFKMHDKLVAVHTGKEDVGTYSNSNLTAYAAEIGFNTTGMANCISGGTYYSVVSQVTADSNAVGVSGTPTIAVNGKILPDPSYTAVKAAIDAALAG